MPTVMDETVNPQMEQEERETSQYISVDNGEPVIRQSRLTQDLAMRSLKFPDPEEFQMKYGMPLN